MWCTPLSERLEHATSPESLCSLLDIASARFWEVIGSNPVEDAGFFLHLTLVACRLLIKLKRTIMHCKYFAIF